LLRCGGPNKRKTGLWLSTGHSDSRHSHAIEKRFLSRNLLKLEFVDQTVLHINYDTMLAESKKEPERDELGIYLAFGSYHLQQNRYEKAIGIYLKCIDKDSNDFRGHICLLV
jgi:tetratricopeptide (TPR) repeat protein